MKTEIEKMNFEQLREFMAYLNDNYSYEGDELRDYYKNFENAWAMQDFTALYYYAMVMYYGENYANEWLEENEKFCKNTEINNKKEDSCKLFF